MLVPSASFHADICTALLHRSPNSMKAFAAALLVAATLTPSLVMAQTPPLTIETSSPYQEVLRRGNTLTLKHKFSVNGAISTDYWFFMHVVDFNNVIRLQDDHPPPSPTSSWLDVNATPKPDVAWTRSLVIPSTFPFGDYKVVAGLYNRNAPGTPRLVLTPGNYVQELSAGSLVGSDYQAVSGISVSGNTIRNPHTPWGIGFIPNPPGTVSNVSATGNTFVVGFNQPSCGGSSTTLTGAECVKVLPPTSSATVSGNTYNGAACP